MSAVSLLTRPIRRRRQRSSRRKTAAAECSPAISRRAISLRNSTGISKLPCVSFAAPKSNDASPSNSPLRSSARTTPRSASASLAPERAARSTRTSRRPVWFCTPASARTVVELVTRVSSPEIAASLPANSRAWPRSSPSAIQTIVGFFCCAAAYFSIADKTGNRSGTNGTGLSARRRSCALAGSRATMSRSASDAAATAASCELRSAAAIWRAAAAILRSQPGAAGQPSSITTSKDPPRAASAGSGFKTGPAIAKMRLAAIARRRSSSHQGVRDAVSFLGRKPRMSRSGGNGTSAGRGGVMRRRKYRSGRPASAARTNGKVKARGRPCISGRLRAGHEAPGRHWHRVGPARRARPRWRAGRSGARSRSTPAPAPKRQ